MYLEEKIEKVEKTLDKRLDTLERLTEERFSEIETIQEDNTRLITATNSGCLDGLLKLCKDIEALSQRVENLEKKRAASENVPSLFPAEQEAE